MLYVIGVLWTPFFLEENYFLRRLSRNNIPVRNAGQEIIIDRDNARYRAMSHIKVMMI